MVVSTVFGKIISIFIIMLVGVLCFKVGIIDDTTKTKLSRLSTQIVNPILIFMSFQMDYDASLMKKMGILFVLAVFSYIISIVLAHFLLKEKEGYDLGIEKYGVTYTNCGFIGLPLAYAMFGNIGVVYATIFAAVFHMFAWTHGILLLENKGFQPKKLINPCLIAVVLGILCFVFQIKIQEHVAFALSSIGDMNTPLAMLLSGAIMAQLNFKETIKKKRLFFVCFLRLILSAGIFCFILRWLPIDEQMRTVAAVIAGCPSGAMTITMAILYKKDDHYATEIFSMTTLLSILTIPLCMLIAG
ncbi:MAG: AEC family transporter [Clostridia bacterium]|nr:AEC family transporter [Lachnospiraceae bacterium]NCB99921.1 AEC family transporter [Clostridia bacterium]NCD04034.1 AEC family transporter [Clostridia bacterium]